MDDKPASYANWPQELKTLWESYEQMFGEMPPLPARKFSHLAERAPELLKENEALRAKEFYNDVFDAKTTQLLIISALAASGVPAVKWHMIAALKAGATLEEIHQIIQLVSAVKTREVQNVAYAALKDIPS